MKRLFLYTLAFVAAAGSLRACSEDDLSSESIVTVDKVSYTPFDYWLRFNYINTYNIDF